ncbi:DUF3732 domain-containing protein [Kosakonia radicincitans]|uniref:DUF3732 domain-containing protein n=1 Tax=Kosakonia radicincitans TaxID=283686 RepID=UPI001D066AAA|nr:DUF3732 domain-containing protein [Kosakonia radicincitans]
MKKAEDSLKPIDALLRNSDGVIKGSVFDDLISCLKVDLNNIKNTIKSKGAIEWQVNGVISSLIAEKDELTAELNSLNNSEVTLENVKNIWEFIGESKGKLEVYSKINAFSIPDASDQRLDILQKEYDAIQVKDVDDERETTIKLIDEVAADLMKKTKDALENYSSWHANFNYAEKRIQLRKPKSTLIENIGSSSNHMFLHLIHFLALHEVAVNKKSPFVPSLLFVDQPSRPYWGEEDGDDLDSIAHSDRKKIKIAFEMLNDFISQINNEYDEEFQIILLEHVPPSMFEGLECFNLLSEFREGNALIPYDWEKSN